MGKTAPNTALSYLSGRIDGWVYRRRHGRVIVTKRPDFSEVEPSAAQIAQRERFQMASAYASRALANPELASLYSGMVEDTESNLHAAAVTDFLKPPVVDRIDPEAFHGEAGDTIAIAARDDTGVIAVAVTVRDAAGATVGQGTAVLVEGLWRFTLAAAVPPEVTGGVVHAVAIDRPGNRTEATAPWTR